jgi:hypothetical protein
VAHVHCKVLVLDCVQRGNTEEESRGGLRVRKFA